MKAPTDQELNELLGDLAKLILPTVSQTSESSHSAGTEAVTTPKAARPAPLFATAPSAARSGYSFPTSAVVQVTADHSKHAHRLHELAARITSHSAYDSVRQEWCALHLQINTLGLWAPGFRPWPKLAQKPRDKCTDHEHAIQRDRLVIESHWLHAHKEFVNVDTTRNKWIALFDHAKPFDFDLAEQFAQQVWGNNHRTQEVLGLTPYQQCQMFSLRTDSTKKHMESFSKPTRGPDNRRIPSPQAVIRTALASWRERQPNLGNNDRLLARAQAKYYLGETASGAQVARLAGFISGTPPQDAKTVAQSLKGLESRLPTGGMAALGGSL
jgi:hypothetical protein